MEHTKECNEHNAKCQADIQGFREAWPNYCQSCQGWGGKSYGGSYWEEPDFEPCQECSDKGVCARCGEPGLASEERGDAETGTGPCSFCGWDYDAGVPDYCDGCICGPEKCSEDFPY